MSDRGDALRVLLVEDDADDAELIVRELRRGGFEVEARRVDTERALRDALESRWDVVLSDFEMPSFDGLRAFELVLAQRVDVPFIFVSGALGEERAVTAMRAGACDYLLKSQLHRLAVTVRRELRSSEERRARRLADVASAEHRRRLEMAVEASGVGVFEQDGDAVYLSDRWGQILGVDPATVTARRFPDWVIERLHPDDRLPFDCARAAFDAGRTERLLGEYRLRRVDGRYVFVLLTAKRFRADHFVGVVEDLTSRHQLEAELRQAQKMEAVGRLAGGVAHDFNNLLTAILGFGDLMSGDGELSPAAMSDLGEIMGAARKASSLTGQLLAFSRRQSVAPRVLDINEVIQDTERLLQRLVGPRMDLALALSEAPETVRIDPIAFEQVLINLAVNARDAMPNGGTLTVTSTRVRLDEGHVEVLSGRLQVGDHCCVTVADTGLGMDADTLRHIFEPFFTTKEPGKGTGLGLSTCYGIVRQAKGSIAVESEPGVGTRFKLFLPIVEESPESLPAPLTAPRREGSGDVVLVVEDDPQVSLLVERSLTRLGYRVQCAKDAAAALAIERETRGPIHLLLTDVLLPGMDGVELATAFASRRPGTPVVFTTGFSDYVAVRREARVLAKPFSPEALAEQVRAALSGRPPPICTD